MAWDTQELPQGDAKAKVVQNMFDAIAPRYDMVNRIMTFRLDVRWRRSTVAALALGDGALVLDVASGTGDLCRELSRQRLQPLSCDFSFGMLAALAFCTTARKRELVSGFGPPSLTAITISFPILVNVFAIADQRFILRAFLNSNALPIALYYDLVRNYLIDSAKLNFFVC